MVVCLLTDVEPGQSEPLPYVNATPALLQERRKERKETMKVNLKNDNNNKTMFVIQTTVATVKMIMTERLR